MNGPDRTVASVTSVRSRLSGCGQAGCGISAAGFLSRPDNNVILDQLYASARWRNLRLDLGMIHPKEEYNGISSTNGIFIRSGNSRCRAGSRRQCW